jgi:ubiquinone/menaquinone biosynthesis C-methylase UbiE
MSNGYWQLEGSAAELYHRYLVPAITTKWAENILDRARPRAGEAILDLACGTGAVARLAAKRETLATIVGLDLNPEMLAVARKIPSEGAPVAWVEGSALHLPFASDSFDVVLCQLGLQFFPDQRRALGEIRRVLRGTGRAAISVYSSIERTPGAHAFVRALDDVLGADASRIKRGEHSFLKPGQLETLLNDAGFEHIDVQTVEQTISFPSTLDYVRFQLLATPMTALLKGKTDDEREAIIMLIASKTESLSTSAMLDRGRFSFPQEAYIASAKNSGDGHS